MSKYIFNKKQDPDNRFDNTNVTIESNSESLPDLLEDFRRFLLACGFTIDGEIDIVKDDE
jgi:hypothetical protein